MNNLKTYFYTSGGVVKAVDGVSFEIHKQEVFGLVGESGSGKTMTALSILKLITPPGKIVEGGVLFNGTNILNADEGILRSVRGSKVSIVFQEPATALNPVFTIGHQITETILAHQKTGASAAKDIALRYLERVHIRQPKKVYYDYPHQLSGGTKQRVMIAMALVNSPSLLILDEPTTALDVTIQAQILDLLDEILANDKLSILFISHDFGIIARMCDRVSIMYRGKIVETGGTKGVLNSPKEPYTKSLIESVKALT